MQNPTFSLCALSLLWREMRERYRGLCNQTLTACQGKACRVKRLNCGLDFKQANMMRFTVFELRLHVAVEKCFGFKNKCQFICSVLVMY